MYQIKPSRYQLTVEPDLKKFSFAGNEVITFEVTTPITEITLDAVDITVFSCSILDKKTSLTFSQNSTTLTIKTKLSKGTHKLLITFEGKLGNNLSGFYRSRVEGEQEEYIATSQFEAADARRAFPCVDHPSYKAVFDITMIVDQTLTALSNGVVTNEEKVADNKKKITFSSTPRMSTYLLYLGAGNFDIYSDTYRDITIRGIATYGKAQYTKFAVECAKKSLEYFEEYFGVPYPLKKLDVIAVPDFAAGAMENWGSITFRENLMLYYKDSSSINTKQRIAEVMAHEVAHQWFGNLVTMKWWDDLWLNESFATFMAYKMVDHYWPEWNIWDEYLVATVFRGMALDSLHSSHPIKVEVADITEATELFDEIAYDKGGSILRMIEGYLGHELFRNGLREYIKEFAYQNTEAKDLWSCLEKVSQKPIVDIMSSQITQTGFPSIKADLKNKVLKLKQTRFILKDDKNSDEVWKLPMTILVGNKSHSLILDKQTASISVGDSASYILLNKNYNSFFISDYSADLLSKLGHHQDQLSAIENQGLIHDLFNLTFAGKKSLNDFLKTITEFFKNEESPSIQLYIIEKLYRIYLLIQHPEVGKSLNYFSQKAIQQTGYEPQDTEHPYITQLRSISLASLALFDDKQVKEFIEKKFTEYLKDEHSLHPNLRSMIYSLAVWFDTKKYQTILDLYKKSNNQEEKIRYLGALGHSKDIKQLQQSLDYVLTDDVRFNQLPFVLSSVAANIYGKKITLEWLFNHWEDLKKKSGGTINHIFRRLLKIVIPHCGTGEITKVQEFIQKNSTHELTKSFEQVMEELEINDAFVKRAG